MQDAVALGDGVRENEGAARLINGAGAPSTVFSVRTDSHPPQDRLIATSVVIAPPIFGCPRLVAGLVASLGASVVFFRGERIADNELDAARVLAGRGFTGQLTFLDAVTGKPRLILTDINKAAKLTVREGPLRFEMLLDRAPTRRSEAQVRRAA
jgi:hypothetical protein